MINVHFPLKLKMGLNFVIVLSAEMGNQMRGLEAATPGGHLHTFCIYLLGGW